MGLEDWEGWGGGGRGWGGVGWREAHLSDVGTAVDAADLDVVMDYSGNDLDSLEVTRENHDVTAGGVGLQQKQACHSQ